MKSFYSLLIAALLSINFCDAQIAYYDAATLEKLLVDGKFPVPGNGCDPNTAAANTPCRKFHDMINLLRPYLSPALREKGPSDIIDALVNDADVRTYNPFLTQLLRPIPQNDVVGDIGKALPSLTTKAITSLGGLDVTNFAQGLAAFLVDRAKEELNVAFFQRLEAVLKAYPEFGVLFPHTQTFLNNYEAWQYANLLATLREAFDKDLQEILGNSIKLKGLTATDCNEKEMSKQAYTNCTNRMNELGEFFKTDEGIGLLTALKLGDALNSGEKIPDAFNSVITSDYLLGLQFGGRPTTQANFAAVVKLLNIVSMSLRSNEVTRHYISTNEFNLLFVPPVNNNLQKIYLGLLYQQVLDAQITINGVNVAGVLRQAAADAGKLRKVITYLEQIRDLADNLQVAYKKFLDDIQQAKENIKESRTGFFVATTRIVLGISNLEVIDPSLNLSPAVAEFISLTNRALVIVQDIQAKNYNAALISLMLMIEQQLDLHRKAINNKDQFPRLKQFTAALLKYGSFAANIVNAKDPDAVNAAIKTIAIPAGGSSIKKSSNWSVSVNAYVGFVYGKEIDKTVEATLADGTKRQVKLHGAKALSVYAPVGLAINKGMNWRGHHPWSVSAFVSIIDVGALVGYRFTNDSTFTGTPKIKMENIFAPGGNIAVGLPNMPITIGAGIQRIAMLDRDPSTNEVYTTNVASWRPQVFLAVDIPVIHLFTDKRTLLNTEKKKRK